MHQQYPFSEYLESLFLSIYRPFLMHLFVQNNKALIKLATMKFYHPYQKLYTSNISPGIFSLPLKDFRRIYSWPKCIFVCRPDEQCLYEMIQYVQLRYNVAATNNLLQLIDHEYHCQKRCKLYIVHVLHQILFCQTNT